MFVIENCLFVALAFLSCVLGRSVACVMWACSLCLHNMPRLGSAAFVCRLTHCPQHTYLLIVTDAFVSNVQLQRGQ